MKLKLFFAASMVLLIVGCTTEPGLDRTKFADLNAAAKDLKTAIRAGKGCQEAEALAQRISAGTAAVQNRTVSKPERDLLSAFLHLQSVTKDGQLLCQTRTLLSGFPFLPKGRIYVPQELDPIVEKYDLPTEKHVYGPTGKHWRSISEDSIRIVWEHAEAEIQHIENMVKYSE